MSTRRILRRHARLVTKPIALVSLACVLIWLICGSALAQAPKGRPPKPGAPAGAGKKPKPPKPPTPPPADDEAPKEERKDPYQHVPVDEEVKKRVPSLRKDFAQAIKSGRYEGEQQNSLQTYLKKYILPMWTLEENYYLLPKYRADLRNELRPGKVGPPHTEAVEIILGGLSRVAASKNFHPIVRYNAMLMIGDLNEQEPPSFNAEPTPLPAAVQVMLDTLLDDQQLDAVRVAALVGLTRHARLGFSDENQQLVNQRLLPALVKLAGEKTPPANRSPDGHEWMRCQAIELLGVLRTPGPNAVVAKALGAIVADKKDVPEKKDKEMLVRCAAARALGSLNYAGVSGLDPVKLADALAGLALDACARGTASSGGDEEEVPIVRRRVRGELHAVSLGLKGIQPLAPEPPNKDVLDAVSKKVDAAAATFDRKDSQNAKDDIPDAELRKAIRQAATAISELIQQRAAPEPPPAEEAAKRSAEESKKPADDKASGDAAKEPADAKAAGDAAKKPADDKAKPTPATK